MDQWAKSEKLTPETLRILREDGFDSLEGLALLSSADINDFFTSTNRLPKEQCLRLRKAVEKLSLQSPQELAICSEHISNDEKKLRFLLVGKTGVGKSTTGNTILGDNKFQTSVGFSSETSQCDIQCGVVSGLEVEITDSPGLFDTSVREDNIAEKIAQAVACLHPGPHAFLFVVKIGRFTQEEEGTYKRLVAIFDEKVTQFMIIVFTGGDNLATAGKTINDIISKAPDGLTKILEACGGRHVVFDNMAADKKPQITELLSTVVTMVKENNDGRYTCPKYMSVGEKMEEELQKRLAKVQERENQHKEYIRQLETKNKALEEEAEKAKKLFEEREKLREDEKKKLEETMYRKIREAQEKLEQKMLTATQMEREKNKLFQLQEGLVKAIEKKQEEDLKKMQEDEKKRKEKADKAMEEIRKMKEKREQDIENEMKKLKESIAKNEDSSFLGTLAGGIGSAAKSVWGTLASFF